MADVHATASHRTVGFVGLGAIGAPMADCLVGTGVDVVVYDISAAATEAFDGRARLAMSPREVADRASVVFACLPDGPVTRAVFAGTDGLVGGEAMTTFVHTGTSGPDLLDELAGAAGDVMIVDSPVTGGVPRARKGDLTAIVAGAPAAVGAVRPLLRSFASKVVVVSERAGDAQRVKLVNNFLSAANLATACEALVVARKVGLDPQIVLDVVNSGSGQNSATLTKLPDYVVPRNFSRGGQIGLMVKDLKEAARLASAAGVPTPLGDAVRACFERALAMGQPTDDVTSLVLSMEDAAGLSPA